MRRYNCSISEKANESLRERKIAVHRQKMLIGIIAALLVSIWILLGTSMSTFASSKVDISSYNKYYTSLKIKSGDTLWDIAQQQVGNFDVSNAEYIDEICRINGISKNEIHAGDYIVIPCYSK